MRNTTAMKSLTKYLNETVVDLTRERDQLKQRVRELEQFKIAAEYRQEANLKSELEKAERIQKAREILETAVRVNSVSIKRIERALEALEGRANENARRETRHWLEAEREGEWQERVAGPALGMDDDDEGKE